MNVLRSQAQPELVYVVLTDAEAKRLRAALRKRKMPDAARALCDQLRAGLKAVLQAGACGI